MEIAYKRSEDELLVDNDDFDFVFKDCSGISVQELYRPVRSELVPKGLPLLGSKEYTWWQEQIYRCLHGWIAPDGRYINGYHYFFCNFVNTRIWDRKARKFDWIAPLWRDNDSEVLDIIWNNRPRMNPDGTSFPGRNHVEAKARGIAWTTYTLMGVALWHFIFTPDAPIGNAYANDDVINKEKQWFQKAWRLLHPVFRSWEGEMLDVVASNKEEFIVGRKLSDKENDVHNTCFFHVIGTDTGAGVYKGERMRLMIAVEAGQWKRKILKSYISENEPSAGLGTESWGMFLVGGTANSIINSSTAYRDLYEQPHTWNATSHFSSKAKVMLGFFDEFTGKSDEKGATEHFMRIRKSKEGDPEMYQQELVENPLTAREAFRPSMRSTYNNAIIAEQIQMIEDQNLDAYWKRCRLVWEVDVHKKRTGNVLYEPHEKGEWLINMEGLPNRRYGNLHIAGIDDRYKTREEDATVKKDHSRNAMVVYRQPTMYPIKSDMPVGVFLGENPDMDVAYDEFYKGMIFWDIKQTMYEHNADTFPQYLRNKGEQNRLYYIGDKKVPGIKVDAKVKTELTFLGSQYFKEGRHLRNTSIEILESMTIWGGKINTDIGSAFHLVLLLLELTKNHEVTEKKEEETKSTFVKLGDPAARAQAKTHTQGKFFRMNRRAA